MDRRYLEAVTRELATSRSRRQVLGTTGMGVIGGLGAALIARGFDLGLLDGDPAPAARAQGVAVSIQDFEFVPPTIEVPVGSEVTWTNDGDAPHTATALDGATFNSNQLSSGQSFSHTFDTVGTIDYFCAIHGPSMSGTVTVVEAVTPTTTPPEPYVRRNVHNLDEYDATLASYAKAIGIMKSWDLESDVTKWTRSWRYQGNMHMAWDNPAEPPLPNPLPPGWTTCEHSFVAYSPYFWPWHRMYIYWFERIVRELSEDPQFALPYWDYSVAANRILPAPFLDTASQLYIAERDFRVNSGTMPTDPPVPESIFDPCGGMGETDYDFAGSSIEGTPHGGIHVWLGGIFAAPGDPVVEGWMADPTKAARDPIFWLHHANIDRLWESWLALGNANRTDSVWLNNDVNGDNGRLYNFFDETGAQVTTIRVVSEVLTVAPLGYEYEELFDPVAAGCPAFMMAPAGGDEAAATPFPTPEAPVELGGSTPAGGIEVGPAPAAVPVALDQPEVAVANANAGRPTVLTLEGIRGQGVPAVVVEVYVNLPAGQEPDSRSPYYVGNLNLFGLLTPHDDVHAEHGSTQRFNIARNVAALEASGEWTGDLQVTLVPYYIASAPEAPGATPEAAAATPVAAPPGPWVTVEGVSVIAR